MSMDELETVAQESTFQIQCAMTHIDWLRGVLHVLEGRLKAAGDSHGATVANLSHYNCDVWHNELDCERESLEKRIEQAAGAPQKTAAAKRGAGGAA